MSIRVVQPAFELRECDVCASHVIRARREGPRPESHCARCGEHESFTTFDLLAIERLIFTGAPIAPA